MERDEMNRMLGMSEEELDARAAEYEADAWDASRLGKVTSGRPAMFGEPMRVVSIREPVSKVERMDARARSLGLGRSEYLRRLIDRDLATV